MRSESEFLAEYAKSHRNKTNQIVHIFCVPLIFLATLGLFWLIPVGHIIPGIPEAYQSWVNVATLGAIPVMAFYLRLSVWSTVTGLVWLAISFAVIVWMERAQLPMFAIFVGTWVAAWAVQFWGHKVEGAKPSFADDLVFLLIGPLFVQQKLQRGL
jgi:uncharacterized membrane protein YGL010W